MDPKNRNAAALTKRVNDITGAMVKHYGNILTTAKADQNVDYSTTAQRELAIKEDTTAFIRNAQDLSTLIRELQELWLFGGLDTLTDPADEEANKAKALSIAAMVEVLTKGPVRVEEKRDEGNGER
ncbi:hypothetical protein K504DRAFT_7175 [Pleomassaria siparia CBS 279.74]|uniref:Mediator of RNA polymerase II transcription subunit 22 n=1 Tax=Pleomassaria siparia CBS 279.74 TaxID=1314801 RepID=A0A6G1KPT5_9PLEO|nr:hypothetical protein K504DRAFT_7175 [Pleomassaria siparia CBS 279.74]